MRRPEDPWQTLLLQQLEKQRCLQILQVDEYSRSVSVDNIWGIGDVINRIPLTPVARMEGTQFALHLFG